MNHSEELLRYPLFDLFDTPSLDSWLATGELLTVSTGETLFQAGTKGRCLYLIQQGQVRVLRPSTGEGETSFGTLGPGDLFGEYALLPPGLNTATCRASSPGKLLRWPLTPLRDTLAQRSEVWPWLKRWLRLHALLSYCRGGLFLGFMSATSVVPLLTRFESVSFPTDRTVQAEGLSDDCWFVIESGQVALHAPSVGPTKEHRVLGRGDSFGARGLLDGRTLSVVTTLAETKCLCLRREAFYQSLDGGVSVSQQSTQKERPAAPRQFPWVGQNEASDCGLAALAMVARYHDLAISLSQLSRKVTLGPAGLPMLELQRLATSIGLRSQPVRLGFEQLASIRLPVIAHWSSGHYVVIYAIKRGAVLVGDPGAGIQDVPEQIFRQLWSNSIILFPAFSAS